MAPSDDIMLALWKLQEGVDRFELTAKTRDQWRMKAVQSFTSGSTTRRSRLPT
jgi:hypothetical protein